MNDGLKDAHRRAIIAELAANPRVERAVLFGSRAMETFTTTSDVDIALFGHKLSLDDQSRLAEAIARLPMPQRVDLLLHHRIENKKLLGHIARHGVEWYRMKARPSASSALSARRTSAMPGEWTTFRLGDVCTKIGSGATPRGGSSVYLDQGDVTLIRSQNVYNDGFHHDGLIYLTETHADQLSNVEVAERDVLLNITGDSVGRACQVDSDVLPARVNQHVAIVRTDPRQLWPRYLRFFLVSPAMQAHMLQLASAGATRNALTKGMIESFDIPAPVDVKEQQAIACILGALDDKIELNRRRNATLEAIARAIFKSWFVDFDPVRAKAAVLREHPDWTDKQTSRAACPGLKPDLAALFADAFEDSELGEIPKGWRVGRLGDIIDIHDSKRIPLSSRERQKRQGSYRYYGAAGIVDYVDDFLFDGIYVLVGEDGSVVTTSGNPVVQYVWGKFWVNNHAHVLKATGGVADEHLLLLLQQVYVTPFVTGAVQPKLSQTNMRAIPVINGSPELNQALGRIVAPLYAKLRMLHDEIGMLAALRDTLLPKLISGELRVPDAERIVGRCA